MHVQFASRKLERCYREFAVARRQWGERVARAYIRRVDILYAARDIGDLFALRALDMHSLKGERKGQYAIRLGDRERLIVALVDEDSTIVSVEEVSKHYGN